MKSRNLIIRVVAVAIILFIIISLCFAVSYLLGGVFGLKVCFIIIAILIFIFLFSGMTADI